MFLRPDINEVEATRSLLHFFGQASPLICNLAKCALAPIACSDIDVPAAIALPMPTCGFFYKYLGLPLSDKWV